MEDLYFSENFQTAVLNGASRNKCDTAQGLLVLLYISQNSIRTTDNLVMIRVGELWLTG
jgi:hypothetical protein